MLLVGAAALPFVQFADAGVVAGLTNDVPLVVFVLVNAALLRLRFAEPDAGGFRAPLTVGRVSVTALLSLPSSVALVALYVSGWL